MNTESNHPVIGDNSEPNAVVQPATPLTEPTAPVEVSPAVSAAHEAPPDTSPETPIEAVPPALINPANPEGEIQEAAAHASSAPMAAADQAETQPTHAESAAPSEPITAPIQDSHTESDAVAEERFVTESPSAERNTNHTDDHAAVAESESATPAAPESAAPPIPESGLKKGEMIEGMIVSTSPTAIEIDLGEGRTGVVQSRELDRMDRATLDALHEGEPILVSVVNPKGEGDRIILSITRAAEEKDWRDAETMRREKGLYVGKIDGFNKGGLIVRFGRLRGFVPESQVSRERRERAETSTNQDKWAGMRGESIAVVVLEVDHERNRLILSEREAVPQHRERQKSQLLDQLQVGDVRVGHIKSLSDFGAFVDIGGADGLVHLTEISWKHITHPQDVLKIGQEVKVEVINIDRDRKRIGLSIRRQEEDPWTTVTTRYTINDLVQGTITKLAKFGAFARLVDDPEIEGLIHITELAEGHVEHPRDVVKEGDVLTLRVVKIDPEQRRIGLSLRRATDPGYMERDYARATGAPPPIEDPADINSMAFKDEGRRRRKPSGSADKPAGGSGGGGGGGKGGGKGGGRRGGGHFDEESEF